VEVVEHQRDRGSGLGQAGGELGGDVEAIRWVRSHLQPSGTQRGENVFPEQEGVAGRKGQPADQAGRAPTGQFRQQDGFAPAERRTDQDEWRCHVVEQSGRPRTVDVSRWTFRFGQLSVEEIVHGTPRGGSQRMLPLAPHRSRVLTHRLRPLGR
jgi:hypothetical protein